MFEALGEALGRKEVMDISVAKIRPLSQRFLRIHHINRAETSKARVCWCDLWNEYGTSQHQDSKSPDKGPEKTLGTVPGFSALVGSGVPSSLGGRRASLIDGTLVNLILKTGVSTEYGLGLTQPQLP